MVSHKREPQIAKPRALLVLKYHDLRREVSHLFEALNKKTALRRLFFTNPSLVLRTKLPSLSSVDVDDQQDEIANKVSFSVLSNDEFLKFLKKYQEEKSKALARLLKMPEDEQAASELDEHTMRVEVAEALLKFGDKEFLFSMIGSSSPCFRSGGPTVLIHQLILLINVSVMVGIHVLVHTVVLSWEYRAQTSGRFSENSQFPLRS